MSGVRPRAEVPGQTKEKLTNPEAARLVETALRDRLEHWLAGTRAQPTRSSAS